MSDSKRGRLAREDRLALTQAIETKVQGLDAAELVQLATALSVPIPSYATPQRRRHRARALGAGKEGAPILKGGGLGSVVSSAQAGRTLDAMTVDDGSSDWAESELVGAGELVERLEIARSTLDNWRKSRKIIAFRKGLRNFVYPLRQFERLKPVEGLDVVSRAFSSPEEAWEWLVAPNRMTSDRPPIDKLREGEVTLVAQAAEGALDYA